jgi:lysozyme family protein
MKSNFVPCLDVVLGYEGGYSDHPKDPGGATLNGVTQGTYDAWRVQQGLSKRPVRQMEAWERNAIYQRNYWDVVNGDTLALGVDLAVFDPAVNSGPARAKKWLMASLGGSDVDTIKRICALRTSFLNGLGTFKVFGKGWMRRVADVEATAIKMAAGADAPAVLKNAAEAATKASTSSKKAAAGAAAGGGVAPAVPTDQIVAAGWGQTATTILVIAAVAVVLVCVYRAYVHAERSDALKEAANG